MSLTRIMMRLFDAWDSEATVEWMFGSLACNDRGRAIQDAIDLCRSLMSEAEYNKFAGYEE